MQSRFLAASAPPIPQYLATTDDEDVRDKLLETLVLLGLASVPVGKI